MKFGKLTDISQVDFSLPEDPPAQAEFLASLPSDEEPARMYIGCTGWSMKEWVGKVYPPGTKMADYLKHYARQFNTIEFNTTHYRIPDAQTVEKWYRESTADFRFCPKLPQSISHSRDFGINSGRITAFTAAIAGLKEKLGCCFMQLPPYFKVDQLPALQTFLQHFPDSIPLALELRHESWFERPQSIEPLVELLQHKNRSLVITDVAGRRDVLHMHVTTTVTMVRFVGNALHPTDYSRIDAWVKRLQKWVKAGLKEIYFFPHEPDNILAPDLSVYLLKQVQKADFAEVRGPVLLDPNAGKQMDLFG